MVTAYQNQKPNTASEAVQLYDSGQNIAAFELLTASAAIPAPTVSDQVNVWSEVFDVLRAAEDAGVHGDKTSYRQFESWCFSKNLAKAPADPATDKRRAMLAQVIRGAAYAILREGYGVVVDRYIVNNKALTIRKNGVAV